jgi:hypothetical protein
MMTTFPCPYLKSDVEFTSEREKHITQRHPDLLPEYREHLRITLADPNQIKRSKNQRLFIRWFDSVRKGKYIVVVVVSDLLLKRHWIVTAYIARRLSKGGTVEWTKD